MVPRDPLAAGLGLVLAALGLVGLLPGLELPLTSAHDLAHLLPGLVLAWAGLGTAAERAKRVAIAATGVAYLGVGAITLVAPDQVPVLLGIPAVANLVHLALGVGLIGLAYAVGPITVDEATA